MFVFPSAAHASTVACETHRTYGYSKMSLLTLAHFASLSALYSCTGDGKCVICDSYVRPCTLVRICDECNYGSYEVNHRLLL